MESEDDIALAPAAGPMLDRAGVEWLEPVRLRLARMHSLGLLPHGFLVCGRAGAVQAEIATWLGALLLCRAAEGPSLPNIPPGISIAPILAVDMSREIDAATVRVMPQVVEWRRFIHAHPELGNRETATSKFVADKLRAMGIEVPARM